MASRGGANRSEECMFYFKVGACRHGDKCVRRHVLPERSPAIVLVSMQLPTQGGSDQEELRELVEDIFLETASLGPISEMFVAANESQHLRGNVYISFESEAAAERVLTNINTRWFAGKPVFAHYLPARTVSSAVCRDGPQCRRQLDCNYAHPIQFDSAFWDCLFASQQNEIQHTSKLGNKDGSVAA